MAFNSKRSKFIIVALIAMLLFGNTLPKGAKAEELFQEESFSDIEETDPTPSPSAVSQTTPSAAPVSLQDEQLSEETPVPQASAGQTEKPTEATPAPTPSPSATQKPETTKTPEASATPLAKKDSFQSGYAEILKGTEVYSEEELYGNSLLGQFTESGSLVYVIERYGEGSSDKEVVLIAFAAMESDELTAQFAYTRVRNLKPIDPKKEKNVKRLISNGAYVYFDEEKEYPVGKCAFEFAASLEEPEILEEETLSEEEVLSEEQEVLDQETPAEEDTAPENVPNTSDPLNDELDESGEEGKTSSEPDSEPLASEDTKEQLNGSVNPASAEETDGLFEEEQSEDKLIASIANESEEIITAAVTGESQTEAEIGTTETSDAITEALPSEDMTAPDDQQPEESLIIENDETISADQGVSTEESQDASDDSVQVVPSEMKAKEEELLEEEVLFGGEYTERASEEMKAEETLIEEALPDDSVVVELNAADNSDSEREPNPVSFTPRVALMGEGQTRSFTLSADSYNPEGAELGEVTKVTVEGGEEAAFSDIEFTEAGTYGFAIMDDAQEEYPWELTVVVDENADLEQLYIDTTKTVYSKNSDTTTNNNYIARFISRNDDLEEIPSCSSEIKAKKVIDIPDFVKVSNSTSYLPYYTNGWNFRFRLRGIDDAPMPDDATDGYKDILCNVSFNKGIESEIYGFGEIEYTNPGKYEYEIEEIISSSVPYFEYDKDSVRKVDVIITQDKETGEMVSSIDYKSDDQYLTFTNRYKCGNVIVKKSVIGDSPEDQEYTIDFSLSGTDNSTNNFANYYIVSIIKYNSDGTRKGVQRFRKDSSTIATPLKLKDGEWFEIIGLPEGVHYEISEVPSSLYETIYENQEDIIKDNDRIEVIITNEMLSVDSISFETKIMLQPYKYSMDSKSQEDNPWSALVFYATLTAEGNSPMPEGTTGNSKTIELPIKAQSKESEIKSFGSIVFTESGVYKYRISQSLQSKYPFFEYDEQEYIYEVTAKKDPETGKVFIVVKLQSGQLSDLAEFENKYIGTNMRILKAVSGKGASSSYSFPIRVKLYAKDGDKEVPYTNWRFTISTGTVESKNGGSSYNVKKTSQSRTNSSGELYLTLSHRDFVRIYGLPNGVHYSVYEVQQTHYAPEYTATTQVNSSEKEVEASRSGTIKKEKGTYFINIKNRYSSIPLTGYNNPIIKTYLLICCLSAVLACAYARHKLR